MLRVGSRHASRSSGLRRCYATSASKPSSFTTKTVSVLVGGSVLFYGASVPIAFYSIRYRDFLVESIPFGESINDLLDNYELQSRNKSSSTTPAVAGSVGQETELTRYAESVAKSSGWELKPPSTTTPATPSTSEVAKARAQDAAREAKLQAAKVDTAIKKAEEKAAQKVNIIKSNATAKAQEVVQQVKEVIKPLEEKVEEIIIPILEKATPIIISTTEAAVPEPVVEDVIIPSIPTPPSTDSSKPRQLDATPIPPKRAKKEVYKGPVLPIGFEPPVGFELPRPPKTPAGELKPIPLAPLPLPLIAPSVKELATSEPILGELAATIDSLATYVLNNSETVSSSAGLVLSTAQGDIEKLGARLEAIKNEENFKLTESLKQQASEYSLQLLNAEKELVSRLDTQEEDWKNAFDLERNHLVSAYKQKLELELETQQEIINARLKEEVIAQGIELQRRWVREIKTRVEQERGSRLAKLEELESGIRKLQKVTTTNQEIVNDSIKQRRLFSAIKAVQHKIQTSTAFEEEITALNKLIKEDDLIKLALETIPEKVTNTGIASFPTLASRFTHSVSPKIRKAALLESNGGIFSYLTSITFSSLLFQKSGWVQGNDVISTIARTEWYLTNKDLEGAAKEINTLEGWPKKLAKDWLEQARNHLEVKQAFEIAEAQATLASLNAL